MVLMTAFGTAELAVEARRMGAFAVLDKPFEMDALGSLVDRILSVRTQ
jgi:DNA-binding NtrC family response regulator